MDKHGYQYVGLALLSSAPAVRRYDAEHWMRLCGLGEYTVQIRDSCSLVDQETTYLSFHILKNPAAGKPKSYARIDIELQPRRKKLLLTIKPAWVTCIVNVSA